MKRVMPFIIVVIIVVITACIDNSSGRGDFNTPVDTSTDLTMDTDTTPNSDTTPTTIPLTGGKGDSESADIRTTSLPRTGQSTCYNVEGEVILCEGTGQDGEINVGLAWPDPRFTVGEGIEADCVTDNLTGLMWVRSPETTPVAWKDALTYSSELSICGYTDWRLPNRKELKGLINYGEVNIGRWLNGQGFSNVEEEGRYWTSTTYASKDTYDAWFVDMYDGYIFAELKIHDELYVWPVRSGGSDSVIDLPVTGQTTCYSDDDSGEIISCEGTGQDGELNAGIAWPDPRFTVGEGIEADCVTDNLTGLMWVRSPETTPVVWKDALTYSSDLSICGYTDWRLPNVNELESLLNAEEIDTAEWLNTTNGFRDVQPDSYWSSTTHALETDFAWVVHMYDGYVHPDGKIYDYYVLPVRSRG